jgi:hypothetical protein
MHETAITQAAAEYRAVKDAAGALPSRAAARRWSAKVAALAGELAGLLGEPQTFCATLRAGMAPAALGSLQASLGVLATLTADDVPTLARAGRPPDVAMGILIERLARLTDVRPGVSREGSGQPGGPFVRLVDAALNEAGDPRSLEAIASAIKRHGQK